MIKLSCFSIIRRKKIKTVKRDYESAKAVEVDKAMRTLQLRLQQPQPVKTVKVNGLKPVKDFGSLIPYGADKKPIMEKKSPDRSIELCEAFYEAEDEQGQSPLNSSEGNVGEEVSDKDSERHLSDPGVGKTEFWCSPKLARSCLNLETHKVDGKIRSKLRVSKTFDQLQLQGLAESLGKDVDPGSSSVSVKSNISADKVMLRKHSSSQVLPSRSRRLWWKLFLWSHRNMHKPSATPKKVSDKSKMNKQGGYSSDTLEPNRAMQFEKMESPLSEDKGKNIMNDEQSWTGLQVRSSSWTQNQWVAFSSEASSSSKVLGWMNNRGPDENRSEDTLYADALVQTLNSSSTVAHISAMDLKAIPNMSCFCSLRTVNLSNNFIVQITPGSLPKGLHTLDLSRNKISNIEGLRELTRLRVLNLSYNRISRVGRRLSNCSILKELYLAGNKISDVEGLHRLLKLTVLDLSFNKITTTKGFGQLVANYNSLQGLNLLGNPVQNNIGDGQLRRTIVGLLPKLLFLNKQAIKPGRARKAVAHGVAKASLGKSGPAPKSRRKTGKKLTQSVTLPVNRSDSVSPKRTGSSPNRGHKSPAPASAGHNRTLKSLSIAKVSSVAIPSSSH